MQQELICEVLREAGKQGKITLLSALNSYDRIFKQKQLDKLSQEGTEIYKILLRWGRDKANLWWEKYDQEYGGDSCNDAMKLDELTTAKTKIDPPSFDEKNALQFLKTIKEHELSVEQSSKYLSSLRESLSHSPPTRDNPLKTFKVSLPKFKDFHEQLKKSAPEFNRIHRQWLLKKSLLVLAQRVNRNMTLRVLEDQAAKKIENTKLKFCFEGWLQANRIRLEKRLTELKGYKASYRICLKLGFKKFLYGIEVIREENLKLEKAITFHKTKCTEKLKICFEGWLQANRIRLEKRLTELKGYKASYRTGLRLGFKKFLVGIEVLAEENSNLRKAIAFYKQKCYEKIIYS